MRRSFDRRAAGSLLTVGLLGVVSCAGQLFAGQRPAEAANPRVVIDKAARELRLYSGDELRFTNPIGLGFQPVGEKRRQGDGATPVGAYTVCVKNPHSRYFLSLGLNYPNIRDAERALAEGRISAAQAAAISEAEEGGTCPPWSTSLGGEIFIHGRGSSADWTLGCIALDDPAMKTLFEMVSVGTKVEILP